MITNLKTAELNVYLLRIMDYKYAKRLDSSIQKISNGKSYEYKHRIKKVLKSFFKFCNDSEIYLMNGIDVSLSFSLWQEMYFLGLNKLSPQSITSDAYCLRKILLELGSKTVDGLPETKAIVPVRKINAELYSNCINEKSKILGGFEFNRKNNDSLTLSLESNVNCFIENLVYTMKKHRDIIYKISKNYLNESIARYKFAQEAIRKIKLEKFENNENLFHPTQKAPISRQPLSLFSNKLQDDECGYSNLIAYIHHVHNGLLTKKFSGGNNHLYRFTDNQYQLREHFGLSSLSAVAACNIIIIESGINVDSLRNLMLTAQGEMHNFFEPNQNGFSVKYNKPRARAIKSRSLEYKSDEPYIEKAFNYLVEVTSHHRSIVPKKHSKKLFIHDSSSRTGIVLPMSHQVFKCGFQRILHEAKSQISASPNWCQGVTLECIDEVIDKNPNAKKLRATEGIIRWFDSEGNPAVAAKFLGNTESVAIRNYLPKELQLAVYNQRVRRFQNVLIANVTNNEDYQIEALDLKNEDELKEYLSRLDKRLPNWKTAIERVSNKKSSYSSTQVKVTLDICPENIAIMKACYEKQSARIGENLVIEDEISTLSEVYINLITYLKKSPDQILNRTIRKGNNLYESNVNTYSKIDVKKIKERK